MQNVFLINASLVDNNILEAIRSLISDAIVVYTHSVDEFVYKAKYYSVQPNIDTIYAVGGDGTVNLLASILIDTNKKLGIMPIGHNNKIYKSIKGSKKIDVGYINDKIFLNHAIVIGDDFNIEEDYSNKFNFKELKDFEFVTNAFGKYKIIPASAIVISNGYFTCKKYCLSDNAMEVFFLKNNNYNKFIKFDNEACLSLNHFNVDLLGDFSIIIDGDIYSVSKFDFNISKDQIEVETKTLSKNLILVKN